MNTDSASFARRTTEYEHIVTAKQVGAANLALRFSCVVFATGKLRLFGCISSAFFAAAGCAIVFAMVLLDCCISAFSTSPLVMVMHAEIIWRANLTTSF